MAMENIRKRQIYYPREDDSQDEEVVQPLCKFFVRFKEKHLPMTY